jgi:hypothetical protein
LAIPRKPPFSASDAPARLQRLKEAYPAYEEEFVLAGLPEAISGDIRQAAATSYEPLLDAGREIVLRQLQQAGSGDRETAARWARVREWLLKDPEELRAWRQLAGVLTGLKDGNRVNPVSELARFLGEDRFAVEFKRVALETPDRLKVRPAGPLSIYHLGTSKSAPAVVLEVAGDPQRDPQRRVTTYTLRAADGRGALTFRPGEELWAEMPLKDADGRDWKFTWRRSPSEQYQMHRLSRPPHLHRKDQDPDSGELANSVVLNATQGQGLPPVPDLMPVVKLEKR